MKQWQEIYNRTERKRCIGMIGETTFQPFAVNTFSKNGRNFDVLTPAHYVHPHNVSSYTRSDGTFVSGYWRDGDGDTSVDRR